MDTHYQRTTASDEWYTPREIIDALGHFDLDPCAPMRPLYQTADVMVDKSQDGLKYPWGGVPCLVQPAIQSATNNPVCAAYGRS